MISPPMAETGDFLLGFCFVFFITEMPTTTNRTDVSVKLASSRFNKTDQIVKNNEKNAEANNDASPRSPSKPQHTLSVWCGTQTLLSTSSFFKFYGGDPNGPYSLFLTLSPLVHEHTFIFVKKNNNIFFVSLYYGLTVVSVFDPVA